MHALYPRLYQIVLKLTIHRSVITIQNHRNIIILLTGVVFQQIPAAPDYSCTIGPWIGQVMKLPNSCVYIICDWICEN